MVAKTKMLTPAMTTAPNTPGAQVPICCNNTPPRSGAMMRVELSTAADKPRIPPISCGATALVSVLESKVLSNPPDMAVGVMMIYSHRTDGASAQPSNENAINTTQTVMSRSSR